MAQKSSTWKGQAQRPKLAEFGGAEGQGITPQADGSVLGFTKQWVLFTN